MLRSILTVVFAILIAVVMSSFAWQGAQAQSQAVNVVVAETISPEGEVIVPVNITGVGGREIFAYQGELVYDPNVLAFQNLEMTGLSSGFSAAVNPYEPGRVKFAAFGIYPIVTDGTLMQGKFIPLQKKVTTEVFFGSFMFNEGNPTVSTFPGKVTIHPKQVNVSGRVLYWSNGAPVHGVILSYTDPFETEPRIAYTEQNGTYSLDVPYFAQGRMTAFKTGEDQYITIYDAATVLGCYIYGWGCNPYIADVTGDLNITALDAREIARFALGYRDDANRLVGQWIFFSPYVQFYGLEEDYYNVDFGAAQKGNISGNYGGILTAASVEDTQDFFSITASPDSITIGVNGFPVQSVQFALEGDVIVEGVQADGFEVLTNGNTVGIYRDSQVESLEIVVNITASSETEVSISDFRIDDDMLVYELWTGIVGPPPTTPHKTTWLPSVLFQTEEEVMPILEPDQQ